MGKEIRISLQETLYFIKNMVDINYNLPKDKASKLDREDFITQVYYTYIREVKHDNKLYLDCIDSALQGNLAPWYNHTLSYNEKAPWEYRKDVIKFIDCLFKERYEVVE